MKKAALTFGLFSLVMVATSFTSPEEVKNAGNKDLNIINPIDNGTSMGRRKSDFAGKQNQLDLSTKQSGSFTTDSQSTRMSVKLD
ncbi:hypothetical protein GJU43_09040 [Flavobacterium sp. LC2016-23]|jgi:hypothetical protein|uniref:hypothetical protein n=1 Tax=Flavobacterium sp. LC2016-23 TaxID=2666330 RepID=UPI0012B0261E|nr:hypothetical protein [Flavobacterium sp. LC2016-23]MRX39418.1 hypothetical protein [Flavobacterium sp. LC2016-23]